MKHPRKKSSLAKLIRIYNQCGPSSGRSRLNKAQNNREIFRKPILLYLFKQMDDLCVINSCSNIEDGSHIKR